MSLFTRHPREMGESYVEHLGHSLVFSGRMLAASVVCLVHGLLPFVWVYKTSDMLARMTKAFVARKPDDLRFVTKICQCDRHDVPCRRQAVMEITRYGARLAVCDRCNMTGDLDRSWLS